MRPFPIVNRPSNSTITILVGYTIRGLPRLEVHSWDRCRVANMRQDASEATRVMQGRHKNTPATDHDDGSSATDASHTLAPSYAQLQQTIIAQPRQPSDRFVPQSSHQVGDPLSPNARQDQIDVNTQPSHQTLNEANWTVTGPPSVAPFNQSQQKQTLQLPGTSTPGLKPVTREPLPREASGGLAPPVTKGAHQNIPATSAGPHLLDHDYAARRDHLADHNYYQPAPEINPPPGFATPQSGRPNRQVNLPTRFQDFDMS